MSQPAEPKYQIEHCRSCHHAIIWARTTSGRSMPVDAAPSDDPGANLLLIRSQGIPRVQVLSSQDVASVRSGPPVALRTSHFATCKQAADWRKPR